MGAAQAVRGPGEIMHEQVYASFQHDKSAVYAHTAMGCKNVMWGSDYPHMEGTFGHTQKTLHELFDDVDDAARYGSPGARSSSSSPTSASRRRCKQTDPTRNESPYPRPSISRAPEVRWVSPKPSPPVNAAAAIVVLQEAFGVNDHIEDICRRFADEGYLAVAPHLFHRTGDPSIGYEDMQEVMGQIMALRADDMEADLDADVRATSPVSV